MAVVDRASGVRVTHPDAYRVEDAPAPGRRQRRARGAPLIATQASQATREVQPLLEALAEHRIEVVDQVGLEPAAPAPRTRGRAARPGPVELSLAIEAEEQAVVLLERDGVYEWKLPDDTERPPAARARRGVEVGPAPGRVTFRIELEAPPPAGRPARGLISDFITGRVQAIVLKFAAHVVVGKAMTHLERDVRPGLVLIGDSDPATWPRVETMADVNLPARRSARILLVIHGTFGSTTGAFGGLAAHAWGRSLLAAARGTYDVVVGYDHRTLSMDPIENASDLLERLRPAGAKHPPQIDVIAHSRGGLVARSLTEHLLPLERDWGADIGRVVFVACTNGGTLFASPSHWKAFVDLYTNLVMAASRLVDLAAPPLVGTITRGAVSGVGAFVKYLVGAALDPDDVPGLAAMDPGGAFVRTINETQTGQPDPQSSRLFVITSDFEVRADRTGPRELPPRLLAMLGDVVVDAVFKKAPNDLVVDVASMAAIDPRAGGFVDDRFDFGINGSVYHCNYFLREEVVDAIGRWLDLSPRADAAQPGSVVREPRLPAQVETDFIELSSQTPVAEAQELLARRPSPYVVVRRPPQYGGYRYAFEHGELTRGLRAGSASRGVGEALNLREIDSSPPVDAPDAISRPPAPPGGVSPDLQPSASRSVVMAGDRVAGVVPEAAALPDTATALEGQRGAAPTQPGEPAGRRRRRETGPAHVHADMPPEVKVDQVVSINVQLSATAFERATSPTSGEGTVAADAIDPDRPLTVQVMSRSNVEVVGDDRAEVAIPAPGDQPVSLLFDVKGVSEGMGEVWVLVRQGNPSLLVLKLTPRVVGEGAQAGRTRVSADGGVPATVATDWALPTLRINERVTGNGVVFEYDLDLQRRGTHRFETKPLLGDRDAFVRRIYKDLEGRWLASKSDAQAFLRDVRGYGGTLFDQLLPTELQQLLWKYRKELKHIRVLSTEPFVPWELVHLKSPQTGRLPRETLFLGQMGLVRWLFDGPGAADSLRCRRGKARYVIPDYPERRYQLVEPAAERRFLETTFGATAVDPHPGPVSKLLRTRGAFDLLHFAGHGVATGGATEDAKLLLEGWIDPNAPAGVDPYLPEFLLATTVRQEANLAKPDDRVRPLVFLNACQVGRLGHQLSSIGGFAESFIKGGAGAFVSSLWNVGDEPAATFGTAFYERLKAGDTVAVASAAAREKARLAGDATWLAYVVYAHPDAKLA